MRVPKDEPATSLEQLRQEVADAQEEIDHLLDLAGLATPYAHLDQEEQNEDLRRVEPKIKEMFARLRKAQKRLETHELETHEMDTPTDAGLNAPFLDPAMEEALEMRPLLTDEDLEKIVITPVEAQATSRPERQAHGPHGQSPARPSDAPKPDPQTSSAPASRAEQMAQRNAEINARVRSGARTKPWNPVAVSKRAKDLSRAAKQKAAAAGIAAIIAGLGLCTLSSTPARTDAAGATAAPAAPTVAVTASAAPTATALLAASAAPVGATLTVAPYYQAVASESCDPVPGSKQEVGSNGVVHHVIRLAPKVVTNPAPGESVSYDWGMVRVFSARCGGFGISLEYERTSAPTTRGFVLFPPSTSYSFVQTQPVSAPGGGRQISTILTVTNHAR